MVDDFGASAKGGAVFSGVVSIGIALVSLILFVIGKSEAAANGFAAAVVTFIAWNVLSWVSYGLYTWTKKELEYNALIFVAGTIFITAGGWWLFYLIWLVVVKINLGVESLIRK